MNHSDWRANTDSSTKGIAVAGLKLRRRTATVFDFDGKGFFTRCTHHIGGPAPDSTGDSGWLGCRLGCAHAGFGFETVNPLLRLLGVRALREELEVGLVVFQSGAEAASLFLRIAELVGSFGVFRLPLQRLFVAADGCAIVALLVVEVANFNALRRFVRIPGMELVVL